MLTEYQKNNMTKNIGIVNGMLMAARRENVTRSIIKVPVNLLTIDEGYQTPVRVERNMDYLVNHWDEHKLLPLTVVPHDEQGVFMIVDGYGRFSASQKVNAEKYKELDCLVVLDAPESKEERRKFETEQYAFQNRDVAYMKPVHKHGAGLIIGDESVKLLQKMKEKYHFEFSNTRGNREPGYLGSYSNWLYVAKTYGEECLTWVLDIISASGFNRRTNGYATDILWGLKDLWYLYPKMRNKSKMLMIAYMKHEMPSVFMAEGFAKYPTLYRKNALSMHCEDLLADAFNVDRMRTFDCDAQKIVKKKDNPKT